MIFSEEPAVICHDGELIDSGHTCTPVCQARILTAVSCRNGRRSCCRHGFDGTESQESILVLVPWTSTSADERLPGMMPSHDGESLDVRSQSTESLYHVTQSP